MNINRHNYETVFLLYVDNELSAAEKKAVELFVQENPDLEEELLMLQQTVITPAPVLFEDKHQLLKKETSIGELQEKLLLYLDKELAKEAIPAVEQSISSNEKVAGEWNLLQQTKLEADKAIIFPDKSSLYRKEGGRVIAFPWRRMAIAAMLLGFGIWAAVSFLQKGTATTIDIPTAKNVIDKRADSAVIATPSKENQLANSAGINTTPVIASPQSNDPVHVVGNDGQVTAQSKKQAIARGNGNEVANNDIDNNQSKGNNLPTPYYENINNSGSNKNRVAIVPIEKQSDNIVPKDDATLAANDTQEKLTAAIANNQQANQPKNVYATTAALTDNTADNSDDRILYIKEEKLKKTKVGAFLGKAKKLLKQKIKANNNNGVGYIELALQ